MKITIIGLTGQTPIFSTPQDLIAAAPSLGLTQKGFETQSHLLAHLIGLPKFKELAGPLGNGTKNGEDQVRYETWEAFELLSR